MTEELPGRWQRLLGEIVAGRAEGPPRALGLPVLSGWEAGRVWGDFNVEQGLCHEGGLFGGWLVAIADAAAGHTLATVLSDDEDIATAAMAVIFMRAVRAGSQVRFHGAVLHRGRRTAQVEVSFVDDEERPVAKVTVTQAVLRAAS